MSNLVNTTGLSLHQQEFLDKVIPLAVLIQEWTIGKVEFRGRIKSPMGVRASLILADILLMSEWGRHPMAQQEFDGKYANNLNLLQDTKNFAGKTKVYNGTEYRTFKTWHDFAANYSDYLVFSDLFTDTLLACDLEEQVSYFSLKKLEPRVYNGKVSALIDFYDLSEIDVYGKGKRR